MTLEGLYGQVLTCINSLAWGRRPSNGGPNLRSGKELSIRNIEARDCP